MNVGLVGGCAGSGCAGSLHGKRERGEFGEDDKMDDFFTQMPSFSNSHDCHSLALKLRRSTSHCHSEDFLPDW